ncbi:sensor histidine kinase [Xylanibacillus composti]|uniref:histidine kinase n=1 Tax=Xylanibacillus composti TaxID=1572762 RepID=A0A8J4M408_9BACL|nr:HAMP domain-containing sensor histidine kinase [Xylanibacillus composti]MDT9726847.1 sensor histidine kinase [Xylanibacillus composti]GIQ70642.1 two-component sensor histidine kinase [Xylanibacillus composti]
MYLNPNTSIFRKILISSIVTVLLGLCAVGLVISFYAKTYIVDSKSNEMIRQAKRVNLSIQNQPIPNESFKDLLLFFDQAYDKRIWIFDAEGNIVVTSSKDEVNAGKVVSEEVVSQVIRGEAAIWNQTEGLEEAMLSVAVPWGKDNNVYGGIVLHSPLKGMDETTAQLRETILWVTLFGIFFSFAVSSYLSWSITRPIKQIDKAAAKIAVGDYSDRIRINSKDEIGELATTINHMMEQLERIDQDKKKLNQLRHDFLANVSHELRTPLTAMLGFLEALQDGLIEEGARGKYYEIMYNETLHMNRLVDDITDLMKLENKEIHLVFMSVDVQEILSKLAFKFRPEAEARGTVIHCVMDEESPQAYADPDRLEQILNNLIKNAVKFTENGTIELRAMAVPSEECVLITVTDTGIGISPEDQGLIWERFFKVERGRPFQHKNSTGLGLAIVRELVELHNGSVRVRSELGKGSTFEVRIPLVQSAAANKQA